MDYFDTNSDKILHFTGHVMDTDKKVQILKDLKNAVKQDVEFKYQAKFCYDPSILKEDFQNFPIFQEVNDNLMQVFHNVLTQTKYDPEINEQHQFAVIFDNFIQKFDFQKIVKTDLYKPILQPLVNQILSIMISRTIKSKKNTVKKEKFSDLEKAYAKLYEEWSQQNHRLTEVQIDKKTGFVKFDQLKPSVSEKIYNMWNNSKGTFSEEDYKQEYTLEQIEKIFD